MKESIPYTLEIPASLSGLVNRVALYEPYLGL